MCLAAKTVLEECVLGLGARDELEPVKNKQRPEYVRSLSRILNRQLSFQDGDIVQPLMKPRGMLRRQGAYVLKRCDDRIGGSSFRMPERLWFLLA